MLILVEPDDKERDVMQIAPYCNQLFLPDNRGGRLVKYVYVPSGASEFARG
jgi:hypothetical protein